jgi:hypothetical protein
VPFYATTIKRKRSAVGALALDVGGCRSAEPRREDALMRTVRECLQRAQDCLRLAAAATDFFVQDALVRRAADCENLARRCQNAVVRRAQAHSRGNKIMSAKQRALPRQERRVCRGNTGAATLRRL